MNVRESLKDIAFMVKKDNYDGLPKELEEYNYYISDCGHSIMCIPKCLYNEAQESGYLFDYEVPFPCRYVLEKGYEIVDGHVICDAPYDSDIGLVIEGDYEEF